MMNLLAYHGHTPTCETEQTSDRVHDFELGLHIAALFAILLTSTFGMFHHAVSDLIARRPLSNHSETSTKSTDTILDIFLCQTFWNGGDYCYCIHTCLISFVQGSDSSYYRVRSRVLHRLVCPHFSLRSILLWRD